MTEGQEKAIRRLRIHKDFTEMDNGNCVVNINDVKIALALIEQQDFKISSLKEEQQENAKLKNELKEKDKIIDLMAERVFLTEKEWKHMKKRRFLRKDFDLKKEIKNYFENKAKEV